MLSAAACRNGDLAAGTDAGRDGEDEPGREPPAAVGRVGAHRADLGVPRRVEPLTGHGDQRAVLDEARGRCPSRRCGSPNGPGARAGDEVEHRGDVVGTEADGLGVRAAVARPRRPSGRRAGTSRSRGDRAGRGARTPGPPSARRRPARRRRPTPRRRAAPRGRGRRRARSGSRARGAARGARAGRAGRPAPGRRAVLSLRVPPRAQPPRPGPHSETREQNGSRRRLRPSAPLVEMLRFSKRSDDIEPTAGAVSRCCPGPHGPVGRARCPSHSSGGGAVPSASFRGTHRRHVDLVRTASAVCPGIPHPRP